MRETRGPGERIGEGTNSRKLGDRNTITLGDDFDTQEEWQQFWEDKRDDHQ